MTVNTNLDFAKLINLLRYFWNFTLRFRKQNNFRHENLEFYWCSEHRTYLFFQDDIALSLKASIHQVHINIKLANYLKNHKSLTQIPAQLPRTKLSSHKKNQFEKFKYLTISSKVHQFTIKHVSEYYPAFQISAHV